VNVNAWSPQFFQSAWTSVFLATSATSSSSTYALRGLDDGDYEVYTWLPGFQLTPPGPKRVNVSGGAGALNLSFLALSGQINLTAVVPGGDDPTLVTYQVEGQGSEGSVSKQGIFSAASTAAITGLGTGLYRVSVQNGNPNRGLRKEAAVAVTNGQTAALSVDLQEQTFAVSGVVSFEGSVLLSTNGTVVNISSAAGMRAYAAPAPVVEVFDFPLPQNFYGSVPPLQTSVASVSAGASTATFQVTGLPAGSYLFRVKNDLDPPTTFNGPANMSLPEFGTSNEVVFVGTAGVSGVALKISNGVELSGTISRPSGDSSSDTRTFLLTLRRSDNLSVLQATTTTSGATASYKYQHLSPGDYILEVREDSFGGFATVVPKYAAEPARITIGQVNVTQNITLKQAGAVVGKLRDVNSNTLLTSQNVASFLPSNFQAYAKANPWVAGGYAQAEYDFTSAAGAQIRISSVTGQFAIYRLVPGTTYDIGFRGFQGLDAQSVARGQKAYAPFTKSGVKIAEGQTVDLGIIDLSQGATMKGSVTDAAGNPLPNVRIRAMPSVGNGSERWELGIEGFTDAGGKFTLQGVDRSRNYYDVTAAPRFDADDVLGALSGVKYGEETLRMVDVNNVTARENLAFTLTAADGVLTGKVVTADGGALEDPFSESDFAAKRARVFLHREGAALGNDPLGEIEAFTDAQGFFSVDALVPGSYLLRAASLGYVTAKKNLVVRSGTNSAGTITLGVGATVSGTLTKPDGTNPNTTEVREVVGVDADFSEFIFGRVEANDDTQLVTGYKLSGFKTGLSYSIIALSESDDILELKSGLTFTSSTETKTLNLIYRPAGPAVFATQSRAGSIVSLSFFSTHKIRNLTDADNDLGQILTLATGNGVILSSAIAASRDTLAMTYQLPANEASFSVRLRFTSAQTDPDDPEGDNFTVDQTFEFFAGAGRSRRVRVANAMGGSAVLEGDPSGATFGSGTFAGDGFELESSSSIEVGVVSATDLSSITGAPQGLGPRNRALGVAAAAQRLGPAAYPAASLYKAVQLAPSVSPFSAFYDIFLPAGVSHSLKKEAFLTLKYDDSVTDPSGINVYYFDEGNGVFLLEGKKRSVDTENKTITVAVDHMSTFVVLQNSQGIVGANSYTGTDFTVYNFPNPFSLKAKAVTLADPGSASASQSIDGTMIKCAVPAGKTGTLKIDIYTMTGDLVRTLTQDASAGGTYYYLPWDGKNQDGKKVASGVYVGRMTLNGNDEKFFKMAVVK